MTITVKSRHTRPESLTKRHPNATIVDVTSRGPEPWVRLSPFFPHGDIPVPFSPGEVGASVEGIWQGLKVFETADVDREVMNNTKMKGIKRTVRKYGRVLGHRKGLSGDELLAYADARRLIYLPIYKWMLENHARDIVQELREIASKGELVLLDYETNCDIDNLAKPLSHAGLVKAWLLDEWQT